MVSYAVGPGEVTHTKSFYSDVQSEQEDLHANKIKVYQRNTQNTSMATVPKEITTNDDKFSALKLVSRNKKIRVLGQSLSKFPEVVNSARDPNSQQQHHSVSRNNRRKTLKSGPFSTPRCTSPQDLHKTSTDFHRFKSCLGAGFDILKPSTTMASSTHLQASSDFKQRAMNRAISELTA